MTTPTHYATVLREGADAEKTIAYMKAKGHLSLLPRIVALMERQKTSDSTVVVAREEDVAHAKKEHPEADIVVDPQIVGGMLVRKGSVLLDATYRRSLVEIYKSAVRKN